MSDRFQVLTVVLDKERREEDLQPILDALKMVRGVAQVKLGEPMGPNDYAARATAASDLTSALFGFLSLAPGGLRSDDDSRAWREISAIIDRERKRRGY